MISIEMAQVRAMVVLTILNSLVAHCGSSGEKIFRVYHQKLNYTEADKACRIKNYDDYLAKIKTTNDLQLAKNKSNTTNGMKYWTGLNLWNGDWEWSDKKMAGIKLVDIVKNLNRTEALSKKPRKFCCLVTHDALLECTNCSEEHAFICEDFQESNFTQVDVNSSCIPAFSLVKSSARNASCIFYEYKGEFCKDIITSLYVYGNQSTLDYGEKETNTFGGYFNLFEISERCKPVIRDLYCRYHFPPCDETLGEPKDRGLCQRSCLYLIQDVCKSEMNFLRNASRDAPVFDQKMINCSLYKPTNGGDAPECYEWPDIPGDDTKSLDCYYGVGVGYRGSVNVTRSGRTCQSWKSQCPHRHWRIPTKDDSNMCRNPDSSAPNGPWCYTTDPNVRWEYCNVSRCPPRELPPPPKRFTVDNVQTRYLILTWDEPENASFHQILSYTVERRTSKLENFTVLKTIPYPGTKMIMEDLEPSTEYTIRLSSNNMHGRSEGVLVTQKTLPNEFIMKLMLKIVLPLSLASLLVGVVCVKYGPIRNSKRGKVYTEPQTPLTTLCNWVEIPRTDVTLKEKLGEGAFGEVYRGLVRMDGQVRACAVKSIKENAREKDRKDLLNELQIMVTVGEHPNIISLIGACTNSEGSKELASLNVWFSNDSPVMKYLDSILVIVRLAPNGCLLDQLKKNRENPYEDKMKRQIGFTRVDKLKIARDVACGMSHLASKKCVHRDLAARNVLLGERNVAMVSDFGMSRDVYESGEYETLCTDMLPVRWMALESLEDLVYNTKTDVYDLMKSCWNLDPEKRPPFADLLVCLEKELIENKEDFPGDKNRLETEPKGITNIVSEPD
ncbi:Angiopoietin-1 receptor [Stylophora pistillata]|uniref:receptor protein-tyrosine kinase n=1 Tax=Stylophora pistillata TaxID=50429 RepID=A0A2B4SFK2_STYPI|nr:Angiopoietin-1 receptor [Stylophora pistillata]